MDKDGHTDMTAHIFPQKRKRHPHRTELSFAPKMRSFVNATSRKRAKNYKQADTKTSPARHFRVAIPLAARAKVRAIFVKRTGLPLGDQIPSRRTAAKPS